MKTLQIVIFCFASLIGSLGLAYVLYPNAKLDDATYQDIQEAKSMEEFDDVIDMGNDHGVLTVIELMGYYLDNPPEAKAPGQAAAPKRQFGGC